LKEYDSYGDRLDGPLDDLRNNSSENKHS